jgi:hypothetical protein
MIQCERLMLAQAGAGEEKRLASWDRRAPALILEDDVQRVDDTGDVTEDGEEDVDAEVGTATALEEDTQRRQDDGKDNLADVAGGERHVG